MTVYEYATRYGITRRSAAEWLDNHARIGNFKKTKKKVDGRWINEYTLVKSSQEPDHATTKRSAGRRG